MCASELLQSWTLQFRAEAFNHAAFLDGDNTSLQDPIFGIAGGTNPPRNPRFTRNARSVSQDHRFNSANASQECSLWAAEDGTCGFGRNETPRPRLRITNGETVGLPRQLGEESTQFRRGLELGDGIQFLECTGERVR